MRARDVDAAPGAGAEYGLARNVVGIGPGRGEKATRALHRFATLPEGVFVWTRDQEGHYHLGRITGPLREDTSPEARTVGITHVRPTSWLAHTFTEDEVPVAVARTFARGGRNFQRIHDDEAERISGELWEGSD